MGTPRGEELEVSRPHTADPENKTNSETQSDSEGQTKEFSERRKWPRYPDKERSGIWFSTPTHGAQHGRLEDVALGGLCVCVTRVYGLELGQQVVVGIGNWMIPARISNMADGNNNNYRIGIEWVRPESPAIVELVERCRNSSNTTEQETPSSPVVNDA